MSPADGGSPRRDFVLTRRPWDCSVPWVRLIYGGDLAF